MNNRGINEFTLSGVVYENAIKVLLPKENPYNCETYTKFILVCGNSINGADMRIPVILVGKTSEKAIMFAQKGAYVTVSGEILTKENINKETGDIEITSKLVAYEITRLRKPISYQIKDFKFRNVALANDPNRYSDMTYIPKGRRDRVLEYKNKWRHYSSKKGQNDGQSNNKDSNDIPQS